jgi:hypothetical protein
VKRRLVFRIITVALTLTLLVAALPLSSVLAVTSVTPASGTVGSYVTITGGGSFEDGDTLFLIQFGSGISFTSSGSVTGGNVTTSFPVPPVSRGSYTITVTDQHSNSDTTLFPFVVTPRITIADPILGTVGTTVTVSGNGFQANSSVEILFDTTTVATTTASATGIISNVTFDVPESTKGTHTIKGVDSVGPSASINFTTNPQVMVVPAEGGVGDLVVVSGNGFAANDAIDLFFDDVLVSGVTAAADDNGSFSTNMAIPSASRGSHTIKAKDDNFNSATATLTIGHKITVAPTDDLEAGDTLTITGSGFDASKTMTITWGEVAIATNPVIVTSSATGGFSASITVPGAKAGDYIVTVSDDTNVAADTVTIITTTTISQTTSQASPGHVGMEFTINGTGYTPGGTISIIYTSDPVTVATTTSDAAGAFSVTFTIPESPGGSHTIAVSDGGIPGEQFDFYMEEQAPVAPALMLPEEATKAKQPVIFDWQDVTDESGVSYTFQLSTDAGFATLVLEQTGLTASDFALPEAQELESVSKDTPYHWRVKAIDGAANESAWSAGTFTVGFTLDLPLWAIIVLSVAGALLMLGLGYWLGRRSVAY